jgi:hypothetical protein
MAYIAGLAVAICQTIQQQRGNMRADGHDVCRVPPLVLRVISARAVLDERRCGSSAVYLGGWRRAI